jgi:MtN3 and saliva related transmembrane protein
MKLTLLDQNVSVTMNVFLSIANIINLIYNVPQVIKTYKTKSTKDFSSWFIFLRILGNIIWIVYAIEIDSLQMLINNCVTVLASLFIGYYKGLEIYREITSITNDENNFEEQLLEYNPLEVYTHDEFYKYGKDCKLEENTLN